METQEETGSDLVSEIKVEDEVIYVEEEVFGDEEDAVRPAGNDTRFPVKPVADTESTEIQKLQQILNGSGNQQNNPSEVVEFEIIEIDEVLSEDKTQKQEFCCFLCMITYSSKVALLHHMNTVHSEQKTRTTSSKSSNVVQRLEMRSLETYKCKICPRSYSLIGNLIRHMKLVHPSLSTCLICAKVFPDADTLKVHVTDHIDQSLLRTNETLPKEVVFTTDGSLIQHFDATKNQSPEIDQLTPHMPPLSKVNFDRISDVRCSKCFKSFSDSKSLENHMYSVHLIERSSKPPEDPNLIQQNASSTKCKFCLQTFTTVLDAQQHLMEFHNVPKSNAHPTSEIPVTTSNAFGKSGVDNSHIDYDSLRCEKCAITFPKMRGLSRHNLVTHSVPATCPICSKVCPSRFDLRFHQERHAMADTVAPDPSLGNSGQKMNAKERIKCEICLEWFYNKHLLELHIDSEHTVDLTCPYSACREIFKRIRAFRDHLNEMHACSRFNLDPSILFGGINTKFQKFTCEKCPRTFTRKSTLKMHLKKLHPVNVTCSICAKVFAGNQELRDHLRFCHKSMDFNKEKCQYCHMGFNYFYQYQQHMLFIHGLSELNVVERENTRKIIPTTDQVLRIILSKLDPAVSKSPEVPEAPKRPTLKSLRKKDAKNSSLHLGKFVCSLCSRVFSQGFEFEKHMEKHDKKQCTYCPKFFYHSQSLQKHLKTHLTIKMSDLITETDRKSESDVNNVDYEEATSSDLPEEVPEQPNTNIIIFEQPFSEILQTGNSSSSLVNSNQDLPTVILSSESESGNSEDTISCCEVSDEEESLTSVIVKSEYQIK